MLNDIRTISYVEHDKLQSKNSLHFQNEEGYLLNWSLLELLDEHHKI